MSTWQDRTLQHKKTLQRRKCHSRRKRSKMIRMRGSARRVRRRFQILKDHWFVKSITFAFVVGTAVTLVYAQ